MDCVPHLCPSGRIKTRGRLIEKQQPWRPDEACPEIEAAALAAGVGQAPSIGNLFETEHLDHRFRGHRRSFAPVSEQVRHHLEVLPPRERRFDRRKLASEADLPSHRGWVRCHVEAANPDLPARRRDERCDGADESGLTRAVRTEKCEDFPQRATTSRPSSAVTLPKRTVRFVAWRSGTSAGLSIGGVIVSSTLHIGWVVSIPLVCVPLELVT